MLLRFVAQNRSGMIKSIFIEGVVHNRCHALLIIKENAYTYSPKDVLSNIYLSIPNSKVTFLGNLYKEQML